MRHAGMFPRSKLTAVGVFAQVRMPVAVGREYTPARLIVNVGQLHIQVGSAEAGCCGKRGLTSSLSIATPRT